MSYPQFQAASDYLGAIADEDYVKALPSNSYEDRGGAVLDGPETGYKVTYTQADAETVTAEDGRVILMDEHLADSDAMDYDMDRADGEWALPDRNILRWASAHLLQQGLRCKKERRSHHRSLLPEYRLN